MKLVELCQDIFFFCFESGIFTPEIGSESVRCRFPGSGKFWDTESVIWFARRQYPPSPGSVSVIRRGAGPANGTNTIRDAPASSRLPQFIRQTGRRRLRYRRRDRSEHSRAKITVIQSRGAADRSRAVPTSVCVLCSRVFSLC